ncbi:poly(A) RNA polymerase GLD2 [Lates japonicus]|uniref:Poly(A) RNA polymerase GLD2 n=1 Tax=Lates japonicus TaxID=270547 RepID=A0AAD3ND37_LATJO|nr:poly(A) RNA polymerase GLD2 [Lates japonicus]
MRSDGALLSCNQILAERSGTGLLDWIFHEWIGLPSSDADLCLVLKEIPSSLPFLPLYCILFSGFVFLGEGQEQVGPLALHSTKMTYHDLCVCKPLERNNAARQSMKTADAIKAQFAESCQILRERKDLNSILPVRAIINKESSRR